MKRQDLSASRRKLEELRCVLDKAPRVWILTHDGPDPDTIAGALALHEVLTRRFDMESGILYGGIIGRADNQAMVDLLDIPLSNIKNVAVGARDHFVCIDTQPSFSNNSLPKGAILAGMIDHHPLATEDGAPFADVRQGYGAVSTILAEYAFAARIEVTQQLATAVAYGIISETEDLGRECSSADLNVYMEMLPRVDHILLGRIRHPRLDRSFFRTLAAAMQNARVFKDVVVCHLGVVNTRDEVAQVADVLSALDGSRWVMCTGREKDGLTLSLRTSDPSASADRVLAQVLGEGGRSGGHGMTAGGQILLTSTDDHDDICRRLTGSFLAAVGHGRDARLSPLLGRP